MSRFGLFTFCTIVPTPIPYKTSLCERNNLDTLSNRYNTLSSQKTTHKNPTIKTARKTSKNGCHFSEILCKPNNLDTISNRYNSLSSQTSVPSKLFRKTSENGSLFQL